MTNDKQIVESAYLTMRWQRGDRSSFDALVRLWERPLLYYLRRLAPSEAVAWEMLQETWIKVFRSLSSLRDSQSFPAFLYRIARNTAISRLRSPEFYETVGIVDEHPDPGSDVTIASLDDAEQVHQALERLPLLQREALTLYFLQDLSLEEMSSVLGIPIGTVKSRLHNGKTAMRQLLSKGENRDK